MKSRNRNIILGIIAMLVVFAVWQAQSGDSVFSGDEYPGFVNHEDRDIPEEVAAQWNIQLNTSRAAFEQDPTDFDALANIAFWEHQFGNFAESRRAIEMVLEDNNIDFTAWTMLGDVAVSMKDWETAEAAYVKSLDMHKDPNLYFKIEQVWRAAFPERYGDIKGLYEEAIKQDGQDPFYLTQLVLWYAEQEMWQEAADHAKIIVDLFPEDENARADYEIYLGKLK